MPVLVLAVVAGLAIGLLGGGSLGHVGLRPLRAWPLLAAALAAQGGAGLAGEGRALPLVLVSYGLLAAFAVANLHLVGMFVVAVGLTMNLVVTAANGAMPVRGDALVAAGVVEPDGLDDLELGARRRLEEPGDRVTWLADVIPVEPARQVLSFGDLVLAVGAADVVARLLLGPDRRRRTVPGGRRAGGRLPSPEGP